MATRQPFAAGLAATVTLGVPAAIVALGLQQGVISPGVGAAIMAAALASIAVSGVGVSLLHRRLTDAPPLDRRLAGAASQRGGAQGESNDDRP